MQMELESQALKVLRKVGTKEGQLVLDFGRGSYSSACPLKSIQMI